MCWNIVYTQPIKWQVRLNERRITSSSFSLSISMGEDSLFSDFSEDLISMVLSSLFCVVRASIMSYIKHISCCISSLYYHQSGLYQTYKLHKILYTVYHNIIIINHTLKLKTYWFIKFFQAYRFKIIFILLVLLIQGIGLKILIWNTNAKKTGNMKNIHW